MQKSNVYLVAIQSSIPETYSSVDLCKAYYPEAQAGRKTAKYASLLSAKIGLTSRTAVLDLAALPVKRLKDARFSPKNWGVDMLRQLMAQSGVQDIGFASVAYNISSHDEVLPNLACQITQTLGLNMDSMPQVLPFYGCAGGIFALNSALAYCQQHQRAAAVFTFDQCSWICNPLFDHSDPQFKENLRANLLFSDGAVAALLVPEHMMTPKLAERALKIIDIDTGYSPGDAIKMNGVHFLVGDDVADAMPPLVAQKSVRPLLAKHGLQAAQVPEWSIHQGGMTVLDKFKDADILGLTDAQISASRDLFIQYGNFSAPSCLFVLEKHFTAAKLTQQMGAGPGANKGLVLGFGAGYYFGTLLYERVVLR